MKSFLNFPEELSFFANQTEITKAGLSPHLLPFQQGDVD
jgi:hypothetical protein